MLLGIYLAQYCINVITYFFLTCSHLSGEGAGMTILKAGMVASSRALRLHRRRAGRRDLGRHPARTGSLTMAARFRSSAACCCP